MEHGLEKRFPTNPNDYKLYEEVGEGVSATVYRALCIPLNQIVGIKVLDLEKCNNDLDGIRREVQTMSLIDHPNTLRAYCSFTVGHNLWVVMPYMAGGSALHIMKYAYPEGFEEPVIATLLYEVLKALAYLHAQGHIHRDVKAGNILIDAKGAVKLADFGVSACMFDTGDRQRARNTFVGTPCWMAPEVMQQLHGYDFKADIWSFGITALELAHGHAPFSKYPPMKVLLMTLQNAPPGLDYERDKRFSKSFKEMLATCLVKDPKRRPTSEKLLKHPFFKHARTNEYSIQTILEGLPPLGERFKALKGREANILLQQNGEQQEYMTGISGWNFNLEDLKSQAALICSLDDVHCTENLDVKTNLKKGYGNIGSSRHDEKDNFANNEASREDLLQDIQDLEGPLASAFSSRPLEALKACFDVSEDVSATTSTQVIQSQLDTVTSRLQASEMKNYKFDMDNGADVVNPSVSLNTDSHVCQKFSVDSLLLERILSSHRNVDTDTERDCIKWSCQRERSHSGSLFHQIKDLPNVTSVVHEEPLEGKVIQRKGRFQITFPNSSPKVASSVNLLTSAVNAAALIPSLQFLWHQNAMQKELLIKLIKCLEQTSIISGGNHTEVSDYNTGDSQLSLASASERILQAYITTLQNSVSRYSEEVQELKLKNFHLKQQINSLSSARKDEKIVK
ncbi:serine/threonine-protein kinase BLUS1-like isoform X2 [Zingiber officinale]|uniref:serine/threonine-protein kinase BLUS1-like isoform X2 n=1 Tax=Zingiber officinale TaxID=94328 RepID=UPI001C4B32C1|nr:serine/threonine-protein kinase BLUS1-like isoform X2 [Zingiber officinale]